MGVSHSTFTLHPHYIYSLKLQISLRTFYPVAQTKYRYPPSESPFRLPSSLPLLQFTTYPTAFTFHTHYLTPRTSKKAWESSFQLLKKSIFTLGVSFPSSFSLVFSPSAVSGELGSGSVWNLAGLIHCIFFLDGVSMFHPRYYISSEHKRVLWSAHFRIKITPFSPSEALSGNAIASGNLHASDNNNNKNQHYWTMIVSCFTSTMSFAVCASSAALLIQYR